MSDVLFEVTYTVVSQTQYLTTQFGGGGHSVELALDPQSGGPILHWGSVPHKITLRDKAPFPALGTKLKMTLEVKT